jgi:hypothetical protein
VLPGLAYGLALAVRPAGAAEAPGSTARRRRVARSAMRSTVEAGGAAPYHARHSGPALCDSSPGGRTPGVTWHGRTGVCRRGSWEVRRGPHAAGAGEAERGSSSRRRASARRARRKLPPHDGAPPATWALTARSPPPFLSPPALPAS